MSEQERNSTDPGSDNSTPAPTQNEPEFFHVFVREGTTAKETRNLAVQQVMERLAIPFRLNKRFRVDGIEFTPSRISRFKVTRSSRRYDPSRLLARIDGSSLGSLFTSMAKASQEELSEEEDVTDLVLAYADELIQANNLVPEGGGLFDRPVQEDKVFLVMSFAPELSDNYDAIKDACKEWNLRLIRVDKEMKSSSIVERILAHLKEANYVVADLTGARPNVYYEIGFFDAVCEARKIDAGEKLLLVAKNHAEAHFDLRHRGIVEYKDPYDLMRVVKRWLTEVAGPPR